MKMRHLTSESKQSHSWMTCITGSAVPKEPQRGYRRRRTPPKPLSNNPATMASVSSGHPRKAVCDSSSSVRQIPRCGRMQPALSSRYVITVPLRMSSERVPLDTFVLDTSIFPGDRSARFAPCILHGASNTIRNWKVSRCLVRASTDRLILPLQSCK